MLEIYSFPKGMFNSPIKPCIEYATLSKRILVYRVCVITEAINVISSLDVGELKGLTSTSCNGFIAMLCFNVSRMIRYDFSCCMYSLPDRCLVYI